MDDHTSRKQIDELADLYLTGVIDDAQKDQAGGQDNPVEGPAPIKLSPKTSGLGGSVDMNPTISDEETQDDPDDRHPVLRLTESDNEEEPVSLENQVEANGIAQKPGTHHENQIENEDETAPQAMLEAVLLGNLPGMSGPWLTQYAQLIAQSEGPVALLHVGEDAIDLELVEPRIEAEPAPAAPTTAVRIPPMRGNRTGLVGLLDALTRSETSPTRTVLVRIDSGDDARSLSRLAAIDDWTMLCGSDDASVAAASQQLRTVIRADPRLADRSVGVMVMGSDEASARQAAHRVAGELKNDLVNRVEFIGHLKRMQPVQVRELGSFPDPVSVWPQLVAWFDTLELPEPGPVIETVVQEPKPKPAPKPKSAPRQGAAKPAPGPRLSSAAANIAMPASRPNPSPAFQPTAPSAPPTQPRPAAQRPKPQPEKPAAAPPDPQPPQADTPTRPAPTPRVLTPKPELDLVALIGRGAAALEEPMALEARIPDQPETQLAVDAQGVVHVLMHDDTGAGDARQAVMRLIEAGRWVREHLELLALTQRDRGFVDQAPTLHLLTGRADLATQLVGRLAGEVRLHLLQQVSLGRESGWFCTPLG